MTKHTQWRQTIEAHYCRWLEMFLEEPWLFEPTSFRAGEVLYTPEFKVDGAYVELVAIDAIAEAMTVLEFMHIVRSEEPEADLRVVGANELAIGYWFHDLVWCLTDSPCFECCQLGSLTRS